MPEPMDLSSVQMTNELTKLVKTTSTSPCTTVAAGGTCTDCYWLTPAIHMSCCAHLHRSSPSASFTKHSFQVETNIAGSFAKLGEEPCNYSLVFAHFDGRDIETDQRIRWEADNICIGQCVNVLWNEHRYTVPIFFETYIIASPQVSPKRGTSIFWILYDSCLKILHQYADNQPRKGASLQHFCRLKPGIRSKGITPSSVKVIPGRVFTECLGKLVPDSDVGHAVKVEYRGTDQCVTHTYPSYIVMFLKTHWYSWTRASVSPLFIQATHSSSSRVLHWVILLMGGQFQRSKDS